jgi:hypothetical protein
MPWISSILSSFIHVACFLIAIHMVVF